MALLEIRSLFKSFGRHQALKCIDLKLQSGDILALLGPSGCGKTTLLRIISGLEAADRGEIRVNGADIAGVPPHLRNFGMMFQELALFPHKNVAENVAFGLEIQKLPPKTIKKRITEMLHLVGMPEFETRKVESLSGGERQRVALARSLAPQPQLLMLDEPLGALDRALRERLMIDLRGILKAIDQTAIFVTHDQAEAFAVADNIAVFDSGKVLQIDCPRVLYNHPASIRVARFLGFKNLLPGRRIDSNHIKTALGTLKLPVDTPLGNEIITVLIRPEAACLIASDKSVPDHHIAIEGSVTSSIFKGSIYHLSMKTETNQSLSFDLSHLPPPPQPGCAIKLAINLLAVTLIKEAMPISAAG